MSDVEGAGLPEKVVLVFNYLGELDSIHATNESADEYVRRHTVKDVHKPRQRYTNWGEWPLHNWSEGDAPSEVDPR